MDDQDPISQFFPDQDSVDLYAVLNLTSEAKLDAIKKSYRRLALVYHPDKHTTSSDDVKANASTKFQQIGFAYAVLSDEKRRQRYDRTGKTDEGFEMGPGDDGWDAYFEDLFDRVTRGKLDEMKKETSPGSAEEVEDLKRAYTDTGGSIGEILTHIPHSTDEDESRFIVIISDLIKKGDLPSLPVWESSIKDEKSRLVRKKQSDKEAKEAEKLAKDLGVWDEFYGSGKTGKRKGKGKGKAEEETKEAEVEDVSALQALILKKKQNNMDGFFDSLAAKYAEPEKKGKGKKRAAAVNDDTPAKKSKTAPPDIDDEEFAKLQEKLFGDKSSGDAGGKKTRAKGRKGK
ncbi:hypothetical protein HGRIS_013075 [Hohenbuehelia grisea]|uniref:J domain-containing protein n=1 Tax=Hohenbuehelia grisea TaxID=104357 RepID=A0ABR3IUI7_9AGAR